MLWGVLQHHWWWMMNTVWDGLEETKHFQGHIIFMEEDHYLFPNAIVHAKALITAKQGRFGDVAAVAMLGPSIQSHRGEIYEDKFVVEDWGVIGYIFNRSVWEKIHSASEVLVLWWRTGG